MSVTHSCLHSFIVSTSWENIHPKFWFFRKTLFCKKLFSPSFLLSWEANGKTVTKVFLFLAIFFTLLKTFCSINFILSSHLKQPSGKKKKDWAIKGTVNRYLLKTNAKTQTRNKSLSQKSLVTKSQHEQACMNWNI